MNTKRSYPVDQANLKQANDVVDIDVHINEASPLGGTLQTTTVISSMADPGGSFHRAMLPEQKEKHIDEFKNRLLLGVEEIENRVKKPIAQDENGRELYSLFDFADLFVILDTLAGCMPCASDENGEGNRFACFMSSYFPAINADGECISFANAKYLYSAGRCGLLHNLGSSTNKKPAQNPQKKISYTHGRGPYWIEVDDQNGKTEITLYARPFCVAVKQAIENAFAVDSFRNGVNQRLGRQDWIVAVN